MDTDAKEPMMPDANQPNPQEPVAGSRGDVIVTRELFDFLMGTGEIDGTSFGDLNDGLPGRFWWRALLRCAERESSHTAHAPSQPTAGDDYEQYRPALQASAAVYEAFYADKKSSRTGDELDQVTIRASLAFAAAMPAPRQPTAGDDEYGNDVEQLRINLAARDSWIVSRGLWSEFVAQLPSAAATIADLAVGQLSGAAVARESHRADATAIRALANKGIENV